MSFGAAQFESLMFFRKNTKKQKKNVKIQVLGLKRSINAREYGSLIRDALPTIGLIR